MTKDNLFQTVASKAEIADKSTVRAASLDDPFYYLQNARQVVQLCLQRYQDLLRAGEIATLERWLALPQPAQALLIRMVMRKGCLFRSEQLNYAEIKDTTQALQQLADAGLIEQQPTLNLNTLASLCRKAECLSLTRYRLPDQHFAAACRKSDLLTALAEHPDADLPQPLNQLWPEAPFQLLELKCDALFERLRLMFFGNLYQSWSEFVLTELGLQRFENVPLTAESRPFQQRSEVDLYLQLQQLAQTADEQGVSAELLAELPDAIGCDWLDYRRQKVLFRLGREAERQKDTALALELYQHSQHREAQLRALRIQEKTEAPQTVFALAQQAYSKIEQPEIRIGLQRILSRSARKAGLDYRPPQPVPIPEQTLTLPRPDQLRVERAVIEHLSSDQTQLFHVENRLLTGLFALLFWDAIYAPVRGAFFNPFQAGPADLYRPGFARARQDLIDAGFKALAEERHRTLILQRLQQKQGISCPLIHWPSLTEPLVQQALAQIPPADLAAVFRHLLLDLHQHRRGLPDLIELGSAGSGYRLIEVKGPGDRLQDHQKLWLQAMLQADMPVSVLHVRWLEETETGPATETPTDSTESAL